MALLKFNSCLIIMLYSLLYTTIPSQIIIELISNTNIVKVNKVGAYCGLWLDRWHCITYFFLNVYHAFTSAGRAFGSSCFLCSAPVLEPKHIGTRPKGEGFWPRVWPEAIDPRLCFGYPRNRGHRVSKFLEIHRSEPHYRLPQTNLTTISPRTPLQQTSPSFETLIVRDHYAASIFNRKAIQIAPNRRTRVICHQHETPKHKWGAGTNQSSSTTAPSNLHRSNRIRPLRQQPLNCVGPHSFPPRTRTCWNEPTFLHRWRIATTSQQSGTE